LNDYGEDLLVQTSHAGRMDASRLWFQVKGTRDIGRYQLKKGGLSLSVSKDHAIRWVRSTDLIVVVLWDVEAKIGWYAVPAGQIDQWDGLSSGHATTTIHFADSDRLTPKVAERLAWESRIDHYRHLTLSARDIDAEAKEDGRDSHLWVLVALEFIHLLGLADRRQREADEYQVQDETRTIFRRYFEEERNEGEGIKEAVPAAAIMTILHHLFTIDDELGLPTVLIEDGSEVLLVLLGIQKILNEARQA